MSIFGLEVVAQGLYCEIILLSSFDGYRLLKEEVYFPWRGILLADGKLLLGDGDVILIKLNLELDDSLVLPIEYLELAITA